MSNNSIEVIDPALVTHGRQFTQKELVKHVIHAMFSAFVLSATHDTGEASHA